MTIELTSGPPLARDAGEAPARPAEHRAPRGVIPRLRAIADGASARGLWLALACGGLGLGAIALAGDYAMGRAGRMGPGYFPTLLGWLLVAAAFAVLVAGRDDDASEPDGADGDAAEARPARAATELRAVAGVIGAIVLFGLALPALGLAGSTLVLVFVAGFASREASARELALLGIALALLASLLFVGLLGVNLPVLPA
ncbi:tripartite tricarboxylate transporter TctB family protein [Derxia gummosa]|uniref:Tripartite tricarboxylate transporter TctB family protein n=1 Tax=Derxia gummosa DSM 723 TaxID=1121388 RepID=A0A8B6X4U6_9BURK|nr:tripartite tricarboxylate transporter TctB family protein [Derxia gummosa]